MVSLIKYYRKPGITESQIEAANFKIQSVLSENIMSSLSTEVCYYIQADAQMLSSEEESILKWLLSVPFEEHNLSSKPSLQEDNNSILIEIGPRLNFSTAFSTNSVAICHSFGFTDIHRIELSTRYLLVFNEGSKLSREEEDAIVAILHDRMTCCRYKSPLTSFNLNVNPEPVFEVDIIGEGQKALEKANKDLGLAFDAWDIDYYTKLFQKKAKRNPTNVECFDLAQSNSEHSRHWFFKGRLVVDGKEWPQSLFKMIMDTQLSTNDNNVIKFNDNSRDLNLRASGNKSGA
ncbi:phosphoribosylformylglycinamidine synthase-like [Plakobranchus ocellatus]|uniref:Phosphoribosylformylglycinamidine synthase-like n=1 Tax=Plakobranchus ocellatus TaxID=259542 RepID=A0AAV4BBA4_9GAST|nr:phosphoribosylformylglycinamidine synthase-like [Plakobranchus ocellatus]